MNTFRDFAPLFRAHDLAYRAARFDAGDVLRQGSVKLVSHAIGGADGDIAHAFEIIAGQIGPCADTCQAYAAKMQKLIVQMPCFLQNFIAQDRPSFGDSSCGRQDKERVPGPLCRL